MDIQSKLIQTLNYTVFHKYHPRPLNSLEKWNVLCRGTKITYSLDEYVWTNIGVWNIKNFFLVASFKFSFIIHNCLLGHAVAQLFEALWVRFPMVSLEFFIDIILPAALWLCGSTQPLTEISTRNICLGVKGGRFVGLTTLWCRLTLNIGDSNSWNPRGLPRVVQELLYLCNYLCLSRGLWLIEFQTAAYLCHKITLELRRILDRNFQTLYCIVYHVAFISPAIFLLYTSVVL
jgi:hypothetical protein